MDVFGFWRKDRGLGDPPDYYSEALKLVAEEKYHEALTSFRLALRVNPDDPEVLQQMAVVYTRIGMPEEAIKFYQSAISLDPQASAAHYGLAFLLYHRGDVVGACEHLRAFLASPPDEAAASTHVEHARKTLRQLEERAKD